MPPEKVAKERKRSKKACQRCSAQKVKCLGEKPPCRACVLSKNQDNCIFPVKPRKITVLDTDVYQMEQKLQKLQSECSRLKGLAAAATCEPSEEAEDLDPLYHGPTICTDSPGKSSGSNVAGSPSCQIFIGNLQWRILGDATKQKFDERATNNNTSMAAEEGRNCLKRIHLNDRVINTKEAFEAPVLPLKAYALEMVHTVFNFFAREYGLFSKAGFEARLNETYKHPNSQDSDWLAYLMITFAVGEQYMNEAGLKNQIPGMCYYISALKYFHEPIEEPNLDSVRTLILIAFYSQGLNRMNSVYAYTGLALSTAVAQGIHRQANNHQFPRAEQEARKKIWWTAFLMDTLWASRLGLPPHFNSCDIDIELPDESMSTEDGFDPKYLIANTHLALLVRSVMREVYGATRESFVENVFCNLKRLEIFMASLKPELKTYTTVAKDNRSTANLHLRYNQLIILTVRPLYLSLLKDPKKRTEEIDRAIIKCTEAAAANVGILCTLFESKCFSAFGFLEAQCCFSSILILIMAVLDGHSFSELPVAVSLNSFMSNIGNITAIDNHCRLRTLIEVLPRSQNHSTTATAKSSVQSSAKPNSKTTPPAETNSRIKSTVTEFSNKFHVQDTCSTATCQSGKWPLDPELEFLGNLDECSNGFEQLTPETASNISSNLGKWDSFISKRS
ncbi:KLTH0E03256p [Lachancea thermotolerans CBS 6340]|uniref:KLTH0E03256p n=1 Tax=Lachancea thermotolerans (strain ATCC 56472 / CBS 6340 / NRRL Y-8284) TaxID=559295 RepID=C5DHC8_LACTC|nr:KLTH0E03256p [Lachancea thermotolerans CBS 6340]CAR23189.1 KLTH0E03256p [Lachancea thermotolerans CBS 6340]